MWERDVVVFPSVRSRRRLVTLFGVGLCLAYVMINLAQPEAVFEGTRAFLRLAGLPVLLALILTLSCMAAQSRTLVLVSLAALAVGIYAAELWLLVRQPDLREAAARAAGRPFDPRPALEVVDAMRAEGVSAVPALLPVLQLIRPGGAGDLLPLAGLANAKTVFCNEDGTYVTYTSDRFGFRNPDTVWDAPVDVVILGDSYAHGACVHDGATLADHIRHWTPGTLTLGVSGNGPFLELAGLREFATRLRPRAVVWAFYEGNDMLDLDNEKAEPLLARYLEDPAFRQGLFDRPAETGAGLARFYEDMRAGRERDTTSTHPTGVDLGQIVKLNRLRTALGVNSFSTGRGSDFATLRLILLTARNAIRGWGGELILLCLPDYATLSGRIRPTARTHAAVLDLARDIGVPVVDAAEAMRGRPDSTSFSVYPGSHLSAAGYRTAAELIIEHLGQAVTLRERIQP